MDEVVLQCVDSPDHFHCYPMLRTLGYPTHDTPNPLEVVTSQNCEGQTHLTVIVKTIGKLPPKVVFKELCKALNTSYVKPDFFHKS